MAGNNFGVIAAGLVAVSGGIAAAQPCNPTISNSVYIGLQGGYPTAMGFYQGKFILAGTFAGDFYPYQLGAWDLTAGGWSDMGTIEWNFNQSRWVRDFEVFDFGNGPELVMAGTFNSVDNVPGSRALAAWNGSSWRNLGTDFGTLGWSVDAMAVWNGKLYIAGTFDTVAGQPSTGIAEWDNGTWRSIGSVSPSGAADTLYVFDDGSGEKLYVGGGFTSIDGAGPLLARWDGTNWSGLPSIAPFGSPSGVNAMTTFPMAGQDLLVVAGVSMEINGTRCDAATWNGSQWTPLPGYLSTEGIYDVAVFDNGLTGQSIYAFGYMPGWGHGVRWNGTSWTTGYGASASINNSQQPARIFDVEVRDGALWVVGDFREPAPAIYRVNPCPPPICPADWDRSGGIDGDDITAFFADWQAGEADIDGSGGTDGDDITFFFVRWQAGC